MPSFVCNFPLFMIVGCLLSAAGSMLMRGKAARNLAMAFGAVLFVMDSVLLAWTVKHGAFTYSMGEFPAPWGNELRAGVLECFMLLVFLLVMLCSGMAGYRFLAEDVDESKLPLYASLMHLLTAALCALIFTNDIFTGYVFLEILTLSSCGLLIVREIGRTTLAAVRYMVLNLLGSGLFLLGVVLLYDITGHLLMVPMHEALTEIIADPSMHLSLAFAAGILTIGLAIKSGLFPFHFWMPDAYGWATPTSASVLSSLVSKAYIFLLLKIYLRVFGPEVLSILPLSRILLVLGILGVVLGSVSALRAGNINRMVAFSSAAQIGYIYMSIGIGGTEGYTAALFHILAHAVTKSILFLSTPRLADVSGESLLFRNLQGAGRKDPFSGAFFTAGALSMIGVPLFAGFASKLVIALSAVDTGNLKKIIPVMIALAASSVLNALYFIRTLIRIWHDPDGSDDFYDPAVRLPETVPYTAACALLLAANLFLGLFSWEAVDLIRLGLSMFS